MKLRKDLKVGDKVIFNNTTANIAFTYLKDKIFTINKIKECKCRHFENNKCPGCIYFKEDTAVNLNDGCYSYIVGILYNVYQEPEIISNNNNEFNISYFL